MCCGKQSFIAQMICAHPILPQTQKRQIRSNGKGIFCANPLSYGKEFEISTDDDTYLVGALVHAMERQVLIESLVFQQIGVSVWVDVLNVSAIRTVFVVVTIW